MIFKGQGFDTKAPVAHAQYIPILPRTENLTSPNSRIHAAWFGFPKWLLKLIHAKYHNFVLEIAPWKGFVTTPDTPKTNPFEETINNIRQNSRNSKNYLFGFSRSCNVLYLQCSVKTTYILTCYLIEECPNSFFYLIA